MALPARRRTLPELPDPDVLDRWQRSAVGPRAQLLIPLRTKRDLRRVAIILRDLAGRYESLGRQKSLDDFAALARAKVEGKAAQDRLAGWPKAETADDVLTSTALGSVAEA